MDHIESLPNLALKETAQFRRFDFLVFDDVEAGKKSGPGSSHSNIHIRRILLSHMHKETVDPLDLQLWRFFVVATKVLNERVGSQKTITLSSLGGLQRIEATYENIGPAIKAVGVMGNIKSGGGNGSSAGNLRSCLSMIEYD